VPELQSFTPPVAVRTPIVGPRTVHKSTLRKGKHLSHTTDDQEFRILAERQLYGVRTRRAPREHAEAIGPRAPRRTPKPQARARVPNDVSAKTSRLQPHHDVRRPP